MQNRYVLLTAAKNEEAYIGQAIKSVVRQTVPPLAWFIVDDGSTDRTAQIVRDFARAYRYIRLKILPPRTGRDFGAQYRAIQTGYESACDLHFDFVGVHDADVAPERTDYYGSVLKQFGPESSVRHRRRLYL